MARRRLRCAAPLCLRCALPLSAGDTIPLCLGRALPLSAGDTIPLCLGRALPLRLGAGSVRVIDLYGLGAPPIRLRPICLRDSFRPRALCLRSTTSCAVRLDPVSPGGAISLLAAVAECRARQAAAGGPVQPRKLLSRGLGIGLAGRLHWRSRQLRRPSLRLLPVAYGWRSLG